MDKLTTILKGNDRFINNIRFADDRILIAEGLEDLQRMFDRVVEISEENSPEVQKYEYIGTIMNGSLSQGHLNGSKYKTVDTLRVLLDTLLD